MILFAAGALLICNLHQWTARREKRTYWYNEAKKRAEETGKALVVIGDPDGGVTHGDYGYGDLCIDLTGCPNAPKGLSIDLSKDKIPYPDNSCVVFCCYVLELVPNPELAYKEFQRVAGKDIFVLCLTPEELSFYSYPGVINDIKAPPFYQEFSYTSGWQRSFK